ncbi:MAG: solute carrier family 23 protein [Pseudomonadota bacterium]
MAIYKRVPGEEQPYWPLGPFQVRLPLVHYRFEGPEAIQGAVVFVVSLAIIPLLETYLGLPYDVALAYVVIGGIGFMLPGLLGVPLVPGWVTPAIPVIIIFLQQFEPGPEAIRALFALQFLVFAIFMVLGVTGLGKKLVDLVPNSLKAGIILGAGIAAIFGEIKPDGRFWDAPVSLLIGTLVCLFLMFSLTFRQWMEHHAFAKRLAQYGVVPALLLAMVIAWIIGEYPLPTINWGIQAPAMGELLAWTPVTLGFPPFEVFLLALPTAIISYIIAFGDIVVGKALIDRVDHLRPDEKIDFNTDRVHLVTGIRNGLHAFLAPYPGLAGPIWTAGTATVAERYRFGPDAMESIYSGGGTLFVVAFFCLFVGPLVSLFQPVLPIALVLTLLITGYLCIIVAMQQVQTDTERGVAGLVAVTLASGDQYAAAYAITLGLILYVLIERKGPQAPKQEATSDPAPKPDPQQAE